MYKVSEAPSSLCIPPLTVMTALKDGELSDNPKTLAEIVETFLRRLRTAIRTRSVTAFVDLFHDEGWYRE